MSRATDLLRDATPLPWMADAPPITLDRDEDQWGIFAAAKPRNTCIAILGSDEQDRADTQLIVYAVNRLPDYEAAVEALERLIEVSQEYRFRDQTEVPAEAVHKAELTGRAALARLRESVPA